MAMTKEQQKAYNKARYEANREAIKARVRAYAAVHRDEIAAYKKCYGVENKEKLDAIAKAYYSANAADRIAKQKAYNESRRDEVRAYKKTWWATVRDKRNSERRGCPRVAAVGKAWYEKNYPNHREQYAARAAKRKALILKTQTEKVDYKQILRDSNGVCGICKKPLDLFGIEFDHVVPLSRGGTHTRRNIQAAHTRCNRSKGARVG